MFLLKCDDHCCKWFFIWGIANFKSCGIFTCLLIYVNFFFPVSPWQHTLSKSFLLIKPDNSHFTACSFIFSSLNNILCACIYCIHWNSKLFSPNQDYHFGLQSWTCHLLSSTSILVSLRNLVCVLSILSDSSLMKI